MSWGYRLRALSRSVSREWHFDLFFGFVFSLLGGMGLVVSLTPKFWQKIALWDETPISIGSVSRTTGNVRYRHQTTPVWLDVSRTGQGVSEGDRILTGDAGEARLDLDSGVDARVFPNSSVVLLSKERVGEEGVFAESGSFSVSVLSNHPSLTVGTARGQFGLRFLSRKNSKSQAVARGEHLSVTRVLLGRDENFGTVGVSVGAIDLDTVDLNQEKKISQFSQFIPGLGREQKRTQILTTIDKTNPKQEVHFLNEKKHAVQISFQSQAVKVGPGESAFLDEKNRLQVIGATLRAVYPFRGQRFVLLETQDISFKWKVLGKTKNQKGLIELRSGNKLKSESIDLASGKKEIALSTGSYQWRVTSGGIQSSWSHFEVYQLQPPILYGPLRQAKLYLQDGQKQKEVVLSWKKLPSQMYANVEVRDTTVKRAGRAGMALRLSPGTYQWRVQAVDQKSGRASDWSEWSNFEIKIRPKEKEVTESFILPEEPIAPPVPEPVKPEPVQKVEVQKKPKVVQKPIIRATKEFKMLKTQVVSGSGASGSTRLSDVNSLNELSMRLRWVKVKKATTYRVEIFTSDGKKLSEGGTKMPTFDFKLKDLKEVEYKYRVSAQLKSGQWIQSELYPIKVNLSAPIPRLPEMDAKETAGTILLTWEKTVLTKGYQVQVSRSDKFEDLAFDLKLRGNFYSIEQEESGIYYWRVRSRVEKGFGPWSKVYRFEVVE